MPNLKNPHDLDIAPAHMVGGMRVKQPAVSHRTPLKEEEDGVQETHEDSSNGLDEMTSEQERMLRTRALQERQAQDLQAHSASRQPDISKNAGNNVQQSLNNAFQPRSMNH